MPSPQEGERADGGDLESVSSDNIAKAHWRRSAGPQAGRAEVRDDAHSLPGAVRLCSGCWEGSG